MRNLRIISSHFSRGFKSIEKTPIFNSSISIQSRRYSSPATQSENVSKIVAEKKEFDLIFRSYERASWIEVTKEVRTVMDLGWEEAEGLVREVPTFLKRGVGKEEAETIIEKLKAVGAKVSMS